MILLKLISGLPDTRRSPNNHLQKWIFLKNIWPLTKGKPALLGLSPCHSGKDAVADGKSMNFTNGIQIHWLPVDRYSSRSFRTFNQSLKEQVFLYTGIIQSLWVYIVNTIVVVDIFYKKKWKKLKINLNQKIAAISFRNTWPRIPVNQHSGFRSVFLASSPTGYLFIMTWTVL